LKLTNTFGVYRPQITFLPAFITEVQAKVQLDVS